MSYLLYYHTAPPVPIALDSRRANLYYGELLKLLDARLGIDELNMHRLGDLPGFAALKLVHNLKICLKTTNLMRISTITLQNCLVAVYTGLTCEHKAQPITLVFLFCNISPESVLELGHEHTRNLCRVWGSHVHTGPHYRADFKFEAVPQGLLLTISTSFPTANAELHDNVELLGRVRRKLGLPLGSHIFCSENSMVDGSPRRCIHNKKKWAAVLVFSRLKMTGDVMRSICTNLRCRLALLQTVQSFCLGRFYDLPPFDTL